MVDVIGLSCKTQSRDLGARRSPLSLLLPPPVFILEWKGHNEINEFVTFVRFKSAI